MPFQSQIYPGEPVIDDTNYLSYAPPSDVIINGEVKSRGRVVPDAQEVSRIRSSLGPFLTAFNLPLIPRSEWEPRIKEMEETKTRLSDQRLQANINSLDQNGTNYCWGNGPTSALHMLMIKTGGPFIPLSPASVCGPIKNFANSGGWGYAALEFMVKNGIVPQKYYPANSRDRSYYNEVNKKIALRYVVTEWLELASRNLEQLMTAALLRLPIAVGYNWWSHEVMGIDPVWINNAPGLRIWNSWGESYGSRGMSVLTGSKMLPDDAVIPLVQSPQWYEDAVSVSL